MKKIFFLLIFLKNGFSFDLHFTDQPLLPLINKKLDNFHSFIILKNEKKNFSASDLNEIEQNTNTSCILMKIISIKSFILRSICGPDICPADFMINEDNATIAPTDICPLNGRTEEIQLYLNNDHNSIYNKMFIIIDGCYILDGELAKTHIYWILSDGNSIERTKVVDRNDFDDLFTKLTSTAFFFNKYQRNCSYLCEMHICEAPAYSILSNWIYLILILIIFILVLVGFYLGE